MKTTINRIELISLIEKKLDFVESENIRIQKERDYFIETKLRIQYDIALAIVNGSALNLLENAKFSTNSVTIDYIALGLPSLPQKPALHSKKELIDAISFLKKSNAKSISIDQAEFERLTKIDYAKGN